MCAPSAASNCLASRVSKWQRFVFFCRIIFAVVGTVETKKKLIRMLFKEINEKVNISKTDIEISIIESPASNWGFRGMTGDEVSLNYKIEV